MKVRKYLPLLGMTVLLQISCSTKDQIISMTTLQGEWDATNIKGEKIIPTEKTPFLGFEMAEQRIYGFTGCNRLTGNINTDELSKGIVDFSKLGCTRMACFEDKYETKFLSALSEIKTIKKEKGKMNLCDEKGNIIIELTKKTTLQK